MQFFKSRFFLGMVALTLVLVLVPSILSLMGFSSLVRGAVNVVFSPVQKLFHTVADALDGYVAYFTDFDELLEENRRLREEVADLREKAYDYDELSEINEWLYGYLELKRQNQSLKMLPATVTGGSSGNVMTLFTLDKGTAHGVKRNMPVLTEDGIVGFVSEAGLNWCKVQVLLESTSAIGVYDERSGDEGILEGEYELLKEGLCRLSYLEAGASLEVGDRLLSSGYGTMYPRGLTVGYVTEVSLDPLNRTPVAYVRLAADLSSLERVMILTGYETEEE